MSLTIVHKRDAIFSLHDLGIFFPPPPGYDGRFPDISPGPETARLSCMKIKGKLYPEHLQAKLHVRKKLIPGSQLRDYLSYYLDDLSTG